MVNRHRHRQRHRYAHRHQHRYAHARVHIDSITQQKYEQLNSTAAAAAACVLAGIA